MSEQAEDRRRYAEEAMKGPPPAPVLKAITLALYLLREAEAHMTKTEASRSGTLRRNLADFRNDLMRYAWAT